MSFCEFLRLMRTLLDVNFAGIAELTGGPARLKDSADSGQRVAEDA